MFGGLFSNGKRKQEPSNYGDESFTDTQVKKSGLLDDLKALGPDIGKDALTLLEKVMSTGEPYDDRTFLVRDKFLLKSLRKLMIRDTDGKTYSSHGITTANF